MTEEEIEKEKSWAVRMAELEEGVDVRAGNKTISDMVVIARLQEDWKRQQEQKAQEAIKAPRKPRTRKPALVK